MAHAVRGDVAVNSAANGWTASLYHLYYFLQTFLPANYDGRVSIVASSPGSGGAWTEAGVTDNAYIVVEFADPWADATAMQVLFAVRDANSAGTVGGVSGGVAIANRGLWAGLAPQGGWDDITKTFGAELFSGLRNAGGRSLDSAGLVLSVDSVWNFGYVDRVTEAGEIDNGYLFLHAKLSGTYTCSFLVGAFTPVNSDRNFPCMLVAGQPTIADGDKYYGYDTAPNYAASLPSDDLSTFHAAYLDNSTVMDGKLMDEFGEYVGYPPLWVNATLGRTVGWFDELARIDTAVTTGSTFDTGMKWGNAGLAWAWGVELPSA